MPTQHAQRCANVANENKWTYDENRVLLGAIEQCGLRSAAYTRGNSVLARLPMAERGRGVEFDASAAPRCTPPPVRLLPGSSLIDGDATSIATCGALKKSRRET